MCVCVCVCVHACVRVCMSVCVHACVHVYVHFACVHMCMRACVHACVQVCMCECMCFVIMHKCCAFFCRAEANSSCQMENSTNLLCDFSAEKIIGTVHTTHQHICSHSRVQYMQISFVYCTYGISVQSRLVYPKLVLSENLFHLTHCCESSLLVCLQFSLIYPTPGLSDTFYEEQTCMHIC